jgi:hypothetical protein
VLSIELIRHCSFTNTDLQYRLLVYHYLRFWLGFSAGSRHSVIEMP